MILNSMKSAAFRCWGERPDVFFESSDQGPQEIADLVNEAAQDICAQIDWQALTRIQTFVGDGVQSEWDIPADYQRQLKIAEIQDLANWAWGYAQVSDLNQFMYLKARGYGYWPGIWTIYNRKFHFYPAPDVGAEASYPYITKNYAIDGDTNTEKPAFTKDNDTFILPERLLTLWLVWKWKVMKGEPIGDEESAFTKALGEYASNDGGSSVYRSRIFPFRGRFTTAYPWPLGY